jgi:hypothetical protein
LLLWPLPTNADQDDERRQSCSNPSNGLVMPKKMAKRRVIVIDDIQDTLFKDSFAQNRMRSFSIFVSWHQPPAPTVVESR